MTVRLLHTADWQLGKPFDKFAGDTGPLLREARLEAVRMLARLANEHQVDAVLVAGDIFDSSSVSRQTITFAIDAMRGFGGPWILLPGNHDAHLAECVWTRILRDGCPPHLRLALEPSPIALTDDRLVVFPAPLCARRTHDDLTAWMDGAEGPVGAARVGLAHGAVEGRLPAAADAGNPIAADRAERARLDYLALGDWHGTLQVAPQTWYAGTPEPDRFPQNDPGNALLVAIEGPGHAPQVTRLRTARYDWRMAEIDCTGFEAAAMTEAVAGRLGELGVRERTLLRLRLRGVLSLAARAALGAVLKRLEDELRYLLVDDAELRDEPDERDLDLLRDGPITGAAVDRLRAQATAGTEEDRAVARLALRYLYVEARGPA